MEEKTTFGKFINQKRKQANLTQKELAEMIHVTESAVSKWERGISYPDITLVSTICDTLHVTEHELIHRQRRFPSEGNRKTGPWVPNDQKILSVDFLSMLRDFPNSLLYL